MEGQKIKSFTDLETWKEGHKLVLETYQLTKLFPKEELFGLTNQTRRCVVSITSNVAEGFSRQTYREKIQFYSISLGSLTELQNQLLVAKDLGYITEKEFQKNANQTITVSKLINGMIKKCKSLIPNT